MKKAAIIIDKWKLSIFERHLREAKREFTVKPGITDDTLTIIALYDGDTPGDMQALGVLCVERMQKRRRHPRTCRDLPHLCRLVKRA